MGAKPADVYAQGWTLRQIGAELGRSLEHAQPTAPESRRHHARGSRSIRLGHGAVDEVLRLQRTRTMLGVTRQPLSAMRRP